MDNQNFPFPLENPTLGLVEWATLAAERIKLREKGYVFLGGDYVLIPSRRKSPERLREVKES